MRQWELIRKSLKQDLWDAEQKYDTACKKMQERRATGALTEKSCEEGWQSLNILSAKCDEKAKMLKNFENSTDVENALRCAGGRSIDLHIQNTLPPLRQLSQLPEPNPNCTQKTFERQNISDCQPSFVDKINDEPHQLKENVEQETAVCGAWDRA